MASYSLPMFSWKPLFVWIFLPGNSFTGNLCRTPRGAVWSQLKLGWCKNVNERSLTSYHHSLWPQGLVFPSPRNLSAKRNWKNPQWKLLTSKKSVLGERTGLWEPAMRKRQVLYFSGCNRGKTNWRRQHSQPLRWNEATVRAQQQGVPHTTVRWHKKTSYKIWVMLFVSNQGEQQWQRVALF